MQNFKFSTRNFKKYHLLRCYVIYSDKNILFPRELLLAALGYRDLNKNLPQIRQIVLYSVGTTSMRIRSVTTHKTVCFH